MESNIPTADAERIGALADALDVLIRFHDREIDAALLGELDRYGIAAGLAGLFQSPDGQAAAAAFEAALTGLGLAPPAEVIDALAADYADLFLTHGYRVAPSASVWLTEDRLERQMPMFDARDWYAHYDITVPNWRVRADDHLVHELQFVSHLCRLGGEVAFTDAGRFLDIHVLTWVPEFCRRAAERVQQPLYSAVMRLTLALLEELRQSLEQATGKPREIYETLPLDTQRQPEPEDAAYMPGVAESW